MARSFIFTSESVSEGHPDKICDRISDALVDLYLASDPYAQPAPYENLVGDLRGACSRRINIQHRLVYQVLEEQRIVTMLRLWTHDG